MDARPSERGSPPVGAPHPYRTTWETRDLQEWIDVLAPDVRLRSPLIVRPFSGREAAIELFEVLFEICGDFRITHEFAASDSHAFFWRAEIGGRSIEGADLIKSNDEGKITEITVLIRPLVDIAAFAAAIGPALARRRSPIRAVLARLLGAPLRPMLVVVDAIGSRLAQKP